MRHIIENGGKSEGKQRRGRHKRAAHLTPLYGCSPGRRFQLVTRFYCLVANYHRLVINSAIYPSLGEPRCFVLHAVEMTCRMCQDNRIAGSHPAFPH